MTTACERLVDALRDDGKIVKDLGGDRYTAQCPAHDDRNPSLSISLRNDGKGVVLHCHTGCDHRDVLAAVGLAECDLFDDPRFRAAYNGHRSYDYGDGRKVHRGDGKRFRQSGNTKGTALFHAEAIGDAELVHVVEGEKDVLAVEAAGGVAVCSAMGAGKAHLADWSPLRGRDVLVVADADVAGRKHAKQVAEKLTALARSVRVVAAKTGKDAADHIANGHPLSEFVPVDLGAPGKRSDDPFGTDGAAGVVDAPRKADGSRFIDPHTGLLARSLADAVMAEVVCGFGEVDDRFYVYENGVWRPNKGRIEAQVNRLLGERFRESHCRNTLSVIRYTPETPAIACDPLPEYINVRNGMLDWDTGKLLAHSPEYLSTVQLPVDYDENASCPQFERFLTQVLPPDCYQPDGDSPGFIWELIGYTLYSGNPLHIAVLLYGKGRNGKGTLIRLLKHMLGPRNCSTVTVHELAENRFRTASLFGKLANLAGDLDSRWLDNTATFKAITGGDTIQGEHKYGHPFEFTPWALPFYSTNKAFGSADSSEGWVARWVVVPFPTCFIGHEDRHLETRLHTAAELRGVMARGIQALPALMARGRLPEPPSVKQAKAEFITASDAVRSWVDEHCERDPTYWAARADLHRAYRQRTEQDRGKPLSTREFYNRLEQIDGIWQTAYLGERRFKGIRLRQPVTAPGAVHYDQPTHERN